jgi:hypothetical protein
MRRAFIAATALALVLVSSPVRAQENSPSIVGVWKLTSFARKEVGTDKVVQPFGEHPSGYRIHTRGGHAFYLFVHENRKAPAGSITDAERVELFKTMTGAGGSYEVEGNRVVFRSEVSTAQSPAGTTLRYQFAIAGRTLTMTTDPIKSPAGGADLYFVTTYERVE